MIRADREEPCRNERTPRPCARLSFVKKVIREILVLLWKVVRTVLWKWLKPRLRRFAFFAVMAIAVLGVLTVLVASSCG